MNILQPLLLSVMMAIGIMVGFKMNDQTDYALIDEINYSDGPKLIGRVEELIRFVENRYVDQIDSDVLLDEAINSVVTMLDPHSVYLSPSELEDVNDQMNGSFFGIGIETFQINDTVNICGLLPGGPAELSGLKVFDKIISIDDSLVAGKKLDFSEVRRMLRVNKLEQIKLKVLRNNSFQTVFLNPSDIPVKTISAAFLHNDSIAFIRIDRFGSNTYKEFMESVEDLFSVKKAKHLILDLRGNPGGYLPEATNILCQIFEEKDRLLIYTEGRNKKRNDYKSTGKRFFEINKIAVLIDENSASASEIVAGAIQDWDRGAIIGRRSFGKGLVQEQYDLNNGGAIRLTVARYYTPSGRSIQKDYTDKEAYDEDIYNRYKNGYMFTKDSLLITDSIGFYSKILNRKLLSSGGITPDIFIPLDSAYADEKIATLDANLPEFVFKQASNNYFSNPKQASDVGKINLSTDFIKELKVYSKTDPLNISDEMLLSTFKSQIYGQISRFMFNKQEALKLENQFDPYIKKAEMWISDKRALSEL